MALSNLILSPDTDGNIKQKTKNIFIDETTFKSFIHFLLIQMDASLSTEQTSEPGFYELSYIDYVLQYVCGSWFDVANSLEPVTGFASALCKCSLNNSLLIFNDHVWFIV